MTNFKTESGIRAQGNSTFEQTLDVWGDINANSDVNITGNLNVTGAANLTFDTSSLSNMIPSANGNDLGTNLKRWDAFLANVEVSSSGRITTTANGTQLGGTTGRFDVWAVDIEASGNTNVGGDVAITGDLTVTGNTSLNGFSITSIIANNAAVVGNIESVTTTSSTVIDSFPLSQVNTWKYIVGMTNGDPSSVYGLEIMCGHNGSFVYTSRYAEINVNTIVATSVDINGSNIELSVTCSSASGANVHNFNVLRLELSK